MSALAFDAVTYRYPGEAQSILEGLSFAVEPGAFHCILGVSGCGKSTIFRLTNGLLAPDAGHVRVQGRDVGGGRHVCGYMPQKDLLLPWRTVGENLALPMEIRGGVPKKSGSIADYCKVHLDMGTSMSGVLGCVRTEDCRCFYVHD